MDPIELLSGRWVVRRRMRDLRSGRSGVFEGTASFQRAGDRLRWDERGRIRFGAHDGPAGRRLAIAWRPSGWMVEFADGRPFHPLDLDGGAVEHRCGDDLYAGSYLLRGRDALDVRWRVRGPAKDLEIVTTYRRTR